MLALALPSNALLCDLLSCNPNNFLIVSSDLNGLTDVNISGPMNGQIIAYENGYWINTDSNSIPDVNNANFLNGFDSNDFIKVDGTSTTTAIIPFAQGISIGSGKSVVFSTPPVVGDVSGTWASSSFFGSGSVDDTSSNNNSWFGQNLGDGGGNADSFFGGSDYSVSNTSFAVVFAYQPSFNAAANASVILGESPIVGGSSVVMLGETPTTGADYDIAIGSGASATGGGTTTTASAAIGNSVTVTDSSTIGLGYDNLSFGQGTAGVDPTLEIVGEDSTFLATFYEDENLLDLSSNLRNQGDVNFLNQLAVGRNIGVGATPNSAIGILVDPSDAQGAGLQVTGTRTIGGVRTGITIAESIVPTTVLQFYSLNNVPILNNSSANVAVYSGGLYGPIIGSTYTGTILSRVSGIDVFPAFSANAHIPYAAAVRAGSSGTGDDFNLFVGVDIDSSTPALRNLALRTGTNQSLFEGDANFQQGVSILFDRPDLNIFSPDSQNIEYNAGDGNHHFARGDVVIDGNLYGGSPLKVKGGLNLSDGSYMVNGVNGISVNFTYVESVDILAVSFTTCTQTIQAGITTGLDCDDQGLFDEVRKRFDEFVEKLSFKGGQPT